MENKMYSAGRGAINFRNKIKVCEAACSGGEYEKNGPFGSMLDIFCGKDDMKAGTFEKAESEMVRMTVNTLMSKAKIKDENVDIMLAGDLMNQCTSTAYGLDSFDIPYVGLYGACSTFALGVLTAGILIDSGHVNNAIVAASSHFCTAERQFRFPLEYGAVSCTTSQNTVTGAGAVLLSRAEPDEKGVMLAGGLYGIVIDRGIRDAANMGAAMATAAADTILRYLGSSGRDITAFDKIATGDLGKEGLSLTREMLSEKNIPCAGILCDCGEMIYDLEKQNVGCGGSGCGCSAVMTAGHFYNELKNGNMKRFGLVGTGALMSPQSLQQGLSIPSVAHMAVLEKAE